MNYLKKIAISVLFLSGAHVFTADFHANAYANSTLILQYAIHLVDIAHPQPHAWTNSFHNQGPARMNTNFDKTRNTAWKKLSHKATGSHLKYKKPTR